MDKSKVISIGIKARNKLIRGVNILYDAVASTLGPNGTTVLIQTPKGPSHTKDGVSVAKAIKLKDNEENLGVQLIQQASAVTADKAGDGPQPLWSKILTPNGFITMGDAEIGMEICGTNGTTQTIVGVFPKGELEIFNIVLSDGQIVECSEDHLFSVWYNRGVMKSLTVKEIIKDYKIKTDNGDNKHKYYIKKYIPELKSKVDQMPLDPYLVGVLIGDGSLTAEVVEISLGLKKEHIIDKLILPEGITLNKTWIESKNYFRVKLVGKNKDGFTMSKIIESLGLNVGSHSKFIPSQYLYSSISDRTKLLQGLIDTDGHINSRNLAEFSSVSETLAKDYWKLMMSLGKHTKVKKIERSKDNGAYSDNPMYRLIERKGYKLGCKIIDIIPTTKVTEMQCIKVSNEDSLYFTDDFVVTHNTTTATVLTAEMVNAGIKNITAGANPNLIKLGMEYARKVYIDELAKLTKEIDDDVQINEIAKISANNDSELGDLIAEAIKNVGINGAITVDDSNTTENKMEIIEGLKIDGRGLISSSFINNETKGICEFKNPLILMSMGEINYNTEIISALDLAKKAERPLFIICANVGGEALQTIIINKMRGIINVAAIRLPMYGEFHLKYMEDIATLVGGNIFNTPKHNKKVSEVTLADFGQAGVIISGQRDTTIIEGGGSLEDLDKRIAGLEAEKEQATMSHHIDSIDERIAKLSGGVCRIHIGAHSEAELKEKKDRIEDALHATRAAIEEGIVIGGGVTNLKIQKAMNAYDLAEKSFDFKVGFDIVKNTLDKPITKILSNSITEDVGEVIWTIKHSDNPNFGYNALTKEFGDLMEMGVIDPARVARVSLETAVSVASTILTTNCIITDEPDDDKTIVNF